VASPTDHLDVRRLQDFQIVALQVSDVPATCRIVAVGGDEAVLEPEVAGQLANAMLPGRATLGFDTDSHPVLLSGMAGHGPIAGTVAFWVTDAIGRRELRLRPRLTAEFDVQLRPSDRSGPAVTRKSIDLSGGGVLVGGYFAPEGTTVELQMPVPGMPRPVACTARVVRQLPVGAALEFVDLDHGVERTLNQFIFAVRQQVARRAFRSAQRAA
jgi:hypothetical protein